MACIRAALSDGSTDDLHKVHQPKNQKSITQASYFYFSGLVFLVLVSSVEQEKI